MGLSSTFGPCLRGLPAESHARSVTCGSHAASQLPCVVSAVQAIVSGQFLNTSFAGPRYVREPAVQPVAAGAEGASGSSSSSSSSSRRTPSTWWQLDLGPQHRLLCNYYVIRHDGSNEGFVRSWALQVYYHSCTCILPVFATCAYCFY